MKIISKANDNILAILRTPPISDSPVRMLSYCVETMVDDGILLFNLLTRELVLLTQEEYANFSQIEYLRSHWFVVPENTNDREYADLVKWILSSRKETGEDITSYTIFPTTDCNARCFYCYELGRSRIPMSQQTALKVVQYIKSHCGGKEVKITWFGGEPLFNIEAIDTICAGLKEEGINFKSRMITNAYLFDDETVKKAVELWNLKSIQVALDGTQEVYNKIKAFIYKNVNPYEIVLNNIQLLLNASIKVSIRLNMDLYNAEDLLTLSKELSQKFGNQQNIKVYAHHLFDGKITMADSHTDEEWQEREEALIRIEDQLSQCDLLSKNGISKKFKFNHCMVDSGNAITILPDGNIGLCEHHSESGFIGHIDREGFDKNEMAKWREVVPPIEECSTCFYYPDCIMLKNCSNGNKCYTQHRQNLLRKTKRKMINEYKK